MSIQEITVLSGQVPGPVENVEDQKQDGKQPSADPVDGLSDLALFEASHHRPRLTVHVPLQLIHCSCKQDLVQIEPTSSPIGRRKNLAFNKKNPMLKLSVQCN